jgi:predicted nucleotidyltransferase
MKTIYEIIFGSHCYGTTTNDSDRDIRGVYLPTLKESLSMKELKDIRKEDKDENGKTTEDRVEYSLQKFFKLAVKSNPSVFEWLFVPSQCILKMEPEGKMLRDARLLFLSKEGIYQRFKGFAYSEFASMTKLTGETGKERKEKILKFGYDPKNAMNVVRLVQQGVELLRDANLTMPRPNAKELIEIKMGKKTYQEITKLFDEALKELEAAKEVSKLPDEPRFEDANDLMIKILMTQNI